MANSTSANLKLTVQATGENSGTWGQITNTNLLILEQAIGGFTTFNLTHLPDLTLFFGGAHRPRLTLPAPSLTKKFS